MSKLFGRLLLITLTGVLLGAVAGGVFAADVSIGCSPTTATTNSIWNFSAVWRDSDGKWPNALADPVSDGLTDYNPTIGSIRPFVDDNNAVENKTWWPQLNDPRGFVGFAHDGSSDPQNWYQPHGYVALQPDPMDTVLGESSSEAGFDHGLDYVSHEADATDGFAGINIQSPNPAAVVDVVGDGRLVQTVIPPAPPVEDDPTTEVDETSPGHTWAAIVTNYSPVYLVGVWSDAAHVHPVKARIVLASDLDDTWPAVNIIQLPDGLPASNRVYVSYYYPGTTYVVTQQWPLPMPFTAYTFTMARATDTGININDAIVHFDPARENLPEFGILGVYDSPALDEDPQAVNYFDTYEPPSPIHPSYGRINLTNIPSAGWGANQRLYVKVSTRAVDAVWTDLEENPNPAAPRRVNYFEKPQWMTGTVVNSKTVTPADASKIRTVVGVYTSEDLTGTNYYPGPGGVPFAQGNATVKLATALPVGTTEVHILYQTGKGDTGAYYAKQGLLKLAVPLPAPEIDANTNAFVSGRRVFLDYRPLSRSSATVGRPILGGVQSIGPLAPAAPGYDPDPAAIAVNPSGRFTLTEEDAILPLGTYALRVTYGLKDADAGPQGVVWLRALGAQIPMYYVEGEPVGGATYRVSVSAGLNMSNPKQQPIPGLWGMNTPQNNPLLIYDPANHPMWYAPGMRPSIPMPAPFAQGYYFDDDGVLQHAECDPMQGLTVIGSRSRRMLPDGSLEMMDYGGGAEQDSLTCYPDGLWPVGYDVDPLSLEPIEESNPTDPDQGSSSTQYVFRVRYHNNSNVPPHPWLGIPRETGVVLFLKLPWQTLYTPLPMNLENPWAKPEDSDFNVYIYRLLPMHSLWTRGAPGRYPWGSMGNYQSLLQPRSASQTYQYFFACSDDSIAFYDGSGLWENNPNFAQFGGIPAIDPTGQRHVIGYDEIDRSAGRRYSADGLAPFDYTIFVDRPNRVPGLFEDALEFRYKWKADSHPDVTCELLMPNTDAKGVSYDDEIYGYGRFLGTIDPYYRSSNPAHAGSHTSGSQSLLAETCGATSKTDVVFRIMYKSKYNQAPIYVRLFVNNASEMTGTTPEHQYTAYTMYPRADQVFANPATKYRDGVWYEYKTKLPPGPHTYYMEAKDGAHVARFPVRPDRYRYATWGYENANDMRTRYIITEGEYLDWWVPTESQATERNTEGYVDNDYFPGPYINHPCVISEPSVTPSSGKEGQNFRYRVKYADPDGQRVYSAYLTVEVNDRGDTRTFQMKPETPIIPPVGSDPQYYQKYAAIIQQYKDGVYYVFDSATVNDFALQKGVRRYYFEFTDDWGRQHDVNDTVKGETTRYPSGSGNWISGPVISGNIRPTLSKGSVESQDGTANAATLWTYRVTYRDLNNEPPAFMKVYLGLLQPDGKTIMWDDGHTMAQSDPNDKVYSDGAQYYFQTRLGAVDSVIAGEPAPAPKQYYYAFEAYDGIDWAVYNSSSQEQLDSRAAGCVLQQSADRLDGTHYSFRLQLAKQVDVANTSSITLTDAQKLDIVRVLGVYQTADLSGTNYYNPGQDLPPYDGGPITLTTTYPAGKAKAWVKYEARAPIIGPLPIDLPAPAGVIPDAQIFQNNSPLPLLIDDQKNGWISADDAEDHGMMTMEGLAIYEGLPSARYVAPNDPRAIASVEGVYLHADFSGTNYYDPEALQPPIWITGTVDPADRTLVTPDEPGRIKTVLGVYDQPDLTGTNYYLGGPDLLWQEAKVVGSGFTGTIWPNQPYDIVSIVGYFTGTDETLPNYYNAQGLASQPVEVRNVSTVSAPDPGSIETILGVYTDVTYDNGGVPTPVGTNYYTDGGRPAPNGTIALTTPLPDNTKTAYVYYQNMGTFFGQTGEYFATSRAVNGATTTKMQIGYHAAGTPADFDRAGHIVLDNPIPGDATQVYIHITSDAFAAGDRIIPLTAELPEPLHEAEPANRTVYIKYHDIRFTHQLRGTAQQPFPTLMGTIWDMGTTHYTPDGANANNVHIQANRPDVTGGIVGVWLNDGRDGLNYFRPYDAPAYAADPLHVRLTAEAPQGTLYMWSRYYQSGDYHIDRWNRDLVFLSEIQDGTSIKGSYFFGTPMPMTLGPNTPCELSDGKLTPLYGTQSTQYVFSVTYRDLDGENGQAPEYVRVYIDDQPYDMTPATAGGTPAYREGAVYVYTPPAGLPGGDHKFHFDASDGVSIAWFDANGAHQSLVGAQISDVEDLNGPYVNNPPTLTNGLATPNPTGGTIGTSDSVDYTVVYTDPDPQNPPYFFDPVLDLDSSGQPLGDSVKVSGSPRVWIDGSGTDTFYAARVKALAADPLEPGKTRTIVAETVANGVASSPNWSLDQFAGKLMQVTDGTLEGRVYLIQSNTSNSLIVATDDLAKDGVKAGANFRIGGLLMKKADSTQQDFAQGVQYKVTVPKLSAGAHKFHFTARSREVKPQWLQEILLGTGQAVVPYSNEVRLPVSGDYNGPTVARTIPPGNQEPVLANNEATALWRGPKAQYATITSPTVVMPTDFLKIRSVQGVYLNANLTGSSYYTPSTTQSPFKAGDTDIKLSPSLPALSDTTALVRLGHPAPAGTIGTNLSLVNPDSPATIGTVLGVYLGADTTLAGTNYYDPATADPAFVAGDTQIHLTTPLPSGTTDVFVKYTPRVKSQAGGVSGVTTVVPTDLAAVGGVVGVYLGSDTNMTGTNYYNPATANPAFVPGDGSITLTTALPADTTAVKIKYASWPVAYVKYFEFADADGVYLAGEPLTFWVQYKDPDNDPPTYHNSVQGYVRVVFNDSGRSTQLLPENPALTNYTQFVPFNVTLTDVPEGTHKYHFEASDGYYDIFYPVGTTTSPRSKDYTIKVNYKPVIRSGSVDHTSGATTFTFTANYQDRDNAAPEIVTVTLKKADDPSVVVTREMTKDPSETSPNYAVGVKYTVQINAKDVPLAPGRYDVVFEANDGHQDADPLAGPAIVVRDTNVAPVILNYGVTPAAGKMSDTFVYNAFYYDAEGDAPVALYNGQRVTGLILVVDKGLATEQRLLMTLNLNVGNVPPGGPPPVPTYQDADGVEFRTSLSGKKLGPGKHTYTVEANDGTEKSVFATGVPAVKSGPILKVPYFSLRVVGKDGSDVSDRAVVGTDVLVTGHMMFPYTEGEAPRSLSNVTIRITKPGGNVIALNASVGNIRADGGSPHQTWIGDITATYSGFVDPALTTGDSLTLTAGGQWTIGAIWPGDAEWDKAETDTNMDGQNDVVYVSVSGPSRTVAVAVPENPDTSDPVIDMITPPMVIGSPYPDAIFGADRALQMQIVRWSPTAGAYFRYGVGGPFPALQPGDAIWIKPRAYNPVTHTGYPAAEPLGVGGVLHLYVDAQDTISIPANSANRNDYVAYVSGVYVNSSLTGTNYYDPTAPAAIASPFRQGDPSFKLTTSLAPGTEVWVSYVIYPLKGVDEGWISLDNPAVAKAIDGGEPRYYHTKYRLIKALTQAYPSKTDSSGNVVLDPQTKLPQLKPCLVSLKAGWNQVGNIFFNWKMTSQQATPVKNNSGAYESNKVKPVDPTAIQGKLLGVYLTADMTGDNYYQPGLASTPYAAGGTVVTLTRMLDTSKLTDATRFYLKYEAYPKEDVGIPISALYVNYLGQRKTLSEAAAAGWIHDYAWRYDAAQRNYVQVHATASGAERVLKAWNGYWIKAFVECALEIDPNVSYGGPITGLSAGLARERAESRAMSFEAPPPIPE